jgi:hypothetical protein
MIASPLRYHGGENVAAMNGRDANDYAVFVAAAKVVGDRL